MNLYFLCVNYNQYLSLRIHDQPTFVSLEHFFWKKTSLACTMTKWMCWLFFPKKNIKCHNLKVFQLFLTKISRKSKRIKFAACVTKNKIYHALAICFQLLSLKNIYRLYDEQRYLMRRSCFGFKTRGPGSFVKRCWHMNLLSHL